MERFRKRIFKAFFNRRPKEEKPKISKLNLKHDSFNNRRKSTDKASKSLHMLKPAELQLILDNVVYPEDMDYDVIDDGSKNTTDESSNYYSKDEILCVVYDDSTKSSEDTINSHSKKFTSNDFAKNMPTFWRLKRKLRNIEKMYPELYYRDQNIFEMFANSRPDTIVRSDVEDVELMWI